jgi:hypothetical protein
MLKLTSVEPKENYILHITLSDNSAFDFDIKTELARIPCYRELYDVNLFKQVKFKNQRIYWNENIDFHLDQMI